MSTQLNPQNPEPPFGDDYSKRPEVNTSVNNPKRLSKQTSNRPKLDETGRVVFTLAGLLVLTWFLGTILYTFIPANSKTRAVAANSQKANSSKSLVETSHRKDNSTLASLAPETSEENPAVEADSGSSNVPDDSSFSPKAEDEVAASAEPNEESRSSSRPKFDVPAGSPDLSENEVEEKPEPEFVPIPQPKIEFVPNRGEGEAQVDGPGDELVDVPMKETEKPNVDSGDVQPSIEPNPEPESEPMPVEPADTPSENVDGPGPDAQEKTYPMRDWISATGGTARMAYVRRAEDGDVIVIDDEGKRFKVPFSRFSPLDQEYIEGVEQ